MQVIDTK